jgi:hypothetical protein
MAPTQLLHLVSVILFNNLFFKNTDHTVAEEEKAEATPGGGQVSTSKVSTLSDGIVGAFHC